MLEPAGRNEVIAVDVELEPFAEALSHADGPAQKAMMVHVDALLHERGRAMGLSEDEIARIRRRFLAGVRQRLDDAAAREGERVDLRAIAREGERVTRARST